MNKELTKQECREALYNIEEKLSCDMAKHGLEKERDIIRSLIKEHFKLKELFELATQELEDFEYHYSMFDLDYAESTLYHTGNFYHTKEQWKNRLKQKLLEKEVKE